MNENTLETILNPSVSWVLVVIVAIGVGGIVSIVKAVIRHRERMAMIEAGMNPDSKRRGAEPSEQ